MIDKVAVEIARRYTARWCSGCKDAQQLSKVYEDGLLFAEQVLAIEVNNKTIGELIEDASIE